MLHASRSFVFSMICTCMLREYNIYTYLKQRCLSVRPSVCTSVRPSFCLSLCDNSFPEQTRSMQNESTNFIYLCIGNNLLSFFQTWLTFSRRGGGGFLGAKKQTFFYRGRGLKQHRSVRERRTRRLEWNLSCAWLRPVGKVVETGYAMVVFCILYAACTLLHL